MKIIRPMSPLRRRMLEDMQIRNYSPHTIDGYLRYAAQFAKHFGTSPDRLGPEHIRTYQLHRNPIFLLEPGDQITFAAVDAKTFAEQDRAAEAGEFVAELMAS